MNTVFLAGGLRTPIGKMGGKLKNFLPEQLAATVLNALLTRHKLSPGDIDQVLLGNVVGTGGNIARVSVLEAGWPYHIPALTVDAQCASGLAAINIGQALVASGHAQLVIAGGTESATLAPARRFNVNDPRFTDKDTFYEQAPFSPDWVGNPGVLQAAETLAREMNIDKAALDAAALDSHRKALAARRENILQDIIAPLSGNIMEDESPRANMDMRLLSRMKGLVANPGLITAGNACLKHDGAAAVLLASEQALARYQLTPLAILHPGVNSGCDPNRFILGPVGAINTLLAKHALTLADIAAVEINEAFAVKILACCRLLSLPPDKVNRLGGALAYGHPYGASGAVIMLHLLKSMQLLNTRYGIAAIGAVGGLGTAALLERI